MIKERKKNLQEVEESCWRLLRLLGIEIISFVFLLLLGFRLLHCRFLIVDTTTTQTCQPFIPLDCSYPQNHSPKIVQIQPNKTYFSIIKRKNNTSTQIFSPLFGNFTKTTTQLSLVPLTVEMGSPF